MYNDYYIDRTGWFKSEIIYYKTEQTQITFSNKRSLEEEMTDSWQSVGLQYIFYLAGLWFHVPPEGHEAKTL